MIAGNIRRRFGLSRKDLHVDVLLACGPSAEAEAHEAAACSQRLDDQAVTGAWPVELVVLVGDYTARLARQAGMLTSLGFRLGLKTVPLVVVRDAWDIGVDPVWSVLGPVTPLGPPVLFPDARPLLADVVDGHCAGYAWRPVDGQWRRESGPLPPELLDHHVEGRGWLSPFRPVGAWPYCVLDVDIHNAIQLANYDGVLSKLNGLFSKSLFFQSSYSGGLHVYVRLPPGMEYADAAVWLTEAMLVHGLLLRTTTPGPTATMRGHVATRLVEVPLHPPRLPFGVGSALRGTPEAAAAVARWKKWRASTDSSDFENARALVEKSRPPKTRWPGRAAWATGYVGDLILEALGSPKPNKLAHTDPWAPHLARLSQSLRVLVTHGCLAFGTRTETMQRLADALVELVGPDQARDLMRYWVEHRQHRSEDIHASKAHVLEFADRLIDGAFEKRGVPTAVWLTVKATISREYATFQSVVLRLTKDESLRAAFHILRLFYKNRTGRTFIAAEQFGLALDDKNVGAVPIRRPQQDRVSEVREALIRIGLITQVRDADYKMGRAAEYELCAPYWPSPPSGSPNVYQPF